MVTQLLFGECFTILEQEKNWTKIKVAFDGYECWIGSKQYQMLSEASFQRLISEPKFLSQDLVSVVTNKSSNIVFPVLLGSSFSSENSHEFSIDKIQFSYEGNTKQNEDSDIRKGLIDAAYMYLNAPYLWGGRGPFGIDCSGFTQMVYKLNGLNLLRDASQQATQGFVLNFVEEALPGDLAFFDNEEGNIIHVGIVLPNNKIIHASGAVRVDEFDHQGIFNNDKRTYTHNLRLLKSILS
jgi:hypothetical protein